MCLPILSYNFNNVKVQAPELITRIVNMRRIYFALFLFSASVISGLAQDISLPELQGYKKVTNYPVFTPDNLWDFINGAADTYLSLGFEELHVAEYVKGKNTIKLEIYRHKDATQAFGIYSSERSASFRFLNIGAQGYKADGSLNFLKGRYYVKIRTNSSSEKILLSLETLALRVADMLPGDAVLPKVLSDFPESGRKKNEETYIRDGVLGHEFLQGAYKAIYEAGETTFSIFIFDKTTPEECRKTVNIWLAKAGIDPDDPAAGKYVFRDGYNGDIFLSWKENRMVVIQGLAKDQTDVAGRYTTEILK
jgi:hypothetical protein